MEGDLNPIGRWYRLVCSCDCGSYNNFSWFKDEEDRKLFKVCENCRERKVKAYEDSLRDDGGEPDVRA